MHIVFKMVWTNIVNHKLDVFDVKTTRAHGSCNEDIANFVLEILNRELTISLVHTTMKHKTLIANVKKLFEEIICINLFLDKD